MSRDRWRSARPMAKLREGRSDWYDIRNHASGPAIVSIYDEVGYFGVTAQDFIRDLNAIDGDVELHLSTPGGEVFDGLAIYGALKQRAGNVAVVVDSLAASIGSVIAMAASPGQLAVMPNATLMIHDGFALCVGNAADMMETAALLEKTSDNIASVYAERSGKPAAEWREAMRAETWYVGQEAVDAGLADRVLTKTSQAQAPAESSDADEHQPAMAATFDLSVFRRTPAALRNQAEPPTPDPVPDSPPETPPPPTPEAPPTEAPADTDRGFAVPEGASNEAESDVADAEPEGDTPPAEATDEPATTDDELLAWLRQNLQALARLSGANSASEAPTGANAHLDDADSGDHGDFADNHTREQPSDDWAWDPEQFLKAMEGAKQ